MQVLSILSNAIILLGTILCILSDLNHCKGTAHPYVTFRYFTTLSNVLCALSALCVLCCRIFAGDIPAWANLFKFIGTTSVFVTFVTVCLFLYPRSKDKGLFLRTGLHMHVVAPLLAVISFAFFERGIVLSFAQSLTGLIPTVLYGIAYLYMVIIRGEEKGGWPDFYGFAKGIFWPISMGFMFAGTFVLEGLLVLMHNG